MNHVNKTLYIPLYGKAYVSCTDCTSLKNKQTTTEEGHERYSIGEID